MGYRSILSSTKDFKTIPDVLSSELIRAWRVILGSINLIRGTFESSSWYSKYLSFFCMNIWPLKPIILSFNSIWKPFITDMTIIKLATPIDKPVIAKNDVKEKIPPLLDLKYLKANLMGRLNTRVLF